MIESFACKDTQQVFEGHCPRRFRSFQEAAERKLQMLDSADDLRDLRWLPGNRLEKLGGDRVGQWSIRINDQWRVCFKWEEGRAINVEITDYH